MAGRWCSPTAADWRDGDVETSTGFIGWSCEARRWCSIFRSKMTARGRGPHRDRGRKDALLGRLGLSLSHARLDRTKSHASTLRGFSSRAARVKRSAALAMGLRIFDVLLVGGRRPRRSRSLLIKESSGSACGRVIEPVRQRLQASQPGPGAYPPRRNWRGIGENATPTDLVTSKTTTLGTKTGASYRSQSLTQAK